MIRRQFCSTLALAAAASAQGNKADDITIRTPKLEAVIRRKGYVSGVAGGSLLDKRTGFRDLGFGLDIVDWIMEPGSDAAYRDQLTGDLKYETGNAYHGNIAKRSIEGPQICTQAKELDPKVTEGNGWTAVEMDWQYRIAAPGRKTGSRWKQTIVFPHRARFFFSSDRIEAVNSSEAMFLRIDMPGHIKHKNGDTFSEVYLSYHGRIPASEFASNFPPDAKFRYRRGESKMPERFIRAYHLRDPKTGADGPWLAGMTLNAGDVYEAWCHQRGYVCMIEEIGGRPVKAGESFGAVFMVGYFDSIEEMHQMYDMHAGFNRLNLSAAGWKLEK